MRTYQWLWGGILLLGGLLLSGAPTFNTPRMHAARRGAGLCRPAARRDRRGPRRWRDPHAPDLRPAFYRCG